MKEMFVSQNSGIDMLVNDPSTSPEDKKLNVVAVLALKNNSSYKAIVWVSNLIRSVIAKQSDRLRGPVKFMIVSLYSDVSTANWIS